MNAKVRKVSPVGHIYINNIGFILLSPHPVAGDSWQKDDTDRWFVTDRNPVKSDLMEIEGVVKPVDIYENPYHVISKGYPYLITYDVHSLPPTILVMDSFDDTDDTN